MGRCGDAAAIGWITPGDPRIEAEWEPLLSALCRYGPQHFGANLGGQMRLIQAFGSTIPALVVEAGRELSDVCSPISRYVSYPLEEARRRARPWQRPLLNAGAGLLGNGLRKLGLERAVYVNNWLLSTNPPLRLNRPQIAALTRWLAGYVVGWGMTIAIGATTGRRAHQDTENVMLRRAPALVVALCDTGNRVDWIDAHDIAYPIAQIPLL